MSCRRKIPNLPIDIVNSILLDLPVKSLLRFKITCKSWCCFIDDGYFINSHLHRSSTDINLLSIEGSISTDSKVVLLNELYLPGFDSIHYFEVRSCGGLVFITYLKSKNMILWNPIIRKYKLIPKLQKKDCFHVWTIYGFAYDVVAEDYKVLCVHDIVNKNTTDKCYIVEIYSIKNQSWRTIPNIFSVCADFVLLRNYKPVSLNGVIYFMAFKRENLNDCVVSFHLVDEKFIVMSMPYKCRDLLSRLNLRIFGDRFCIMGTFDKEFLIWSLEKDWKTWNNITRFPTLGMIGYYGSDVICIKENGNILCRMDGGRFIEYNVRKNGYTKFEVKEFPPSVKIGRLYVESLASLKISWD
ncbi:hypothetical protein R3W88_027230 [Solanum pinnatisectum]|uniref:F-box domain-containing protein n=1 Tax=Solanum pinnatisectum TaxID=50273 RepID=A0AAV9LFF3_9SOLN|nr:hypothetical protein R3W88_027230 [Solanum pinnatisectum]